MNRYLSLPLVLTIGVFAVVYLSKTSIGEPPVEIEAATTPTSNEPLSYQQIETTILDQWPTLGHGVWASRAAPRISLYASIGGGQDIDESGRIDPNSEVFLCGLYVSYVPKDERKENWNKYQHDRFAVHVDRHSQATKIFADGQWQDYSEWRDVAIQRYSKLDGRNPKNSE